MPAHSGIVIVGAGLAGVKAAQALRLDHGYDGPITLIATAHPAGPRRLADPGAPAADLLPSLP